jgi:hypothetical protein
VVKCTVAVGAWLKTAGEIDVNNDGGKVSIYHLIIQCTYIYRDACGGAVGRGTELQAGRLRFRLLAV